MITASIEARVDLTDQLMNTPLAGASLRDTTPEAASTFGLSGVVVESVQANTPAALAGLWPQDIIVAINRAAVSSTQQLLSFVAEQRAILALELIRDGKRLMLVAR